ncbi:ABC transporter substrate-binding protein [Paenibacillus mucilaginosus]|uniref:Extracellular solute-binding protein family 1 n=1 Tax=Paenibacillus mucilaginosus (strain KNP414) TaxID=1036673 RepID=F8FRE5_PAEMK|nr:sugar ABC transporter substrate-binding protein [Paenibacillus mucilaginosus]AEI40502.1 extracellular solute-binding protein family 1 [Paenibacillus mucilaginosus KNP414]MCG7213156.1 sugar ABC transporter substrate-binding protein [Paenibacillus mucilaginosus]WDM29674.1 sugar ABC transporter substrate-binding protein [Paenibacillus mucilaginosus]
MVRWTRRLLYLLLGAGTLGAALLLAAGLEEDPLPAQRPFEGQRLTVYLAEHPWTDIISGQADEFKRETGVELQLVQVTEEQLQEKLAVQLISRSDTPDVFMYRPYMDKQLYFKRGWLTPLNAYVSGSPDYDIADLTASAMETNKVGDAITSIPVFLDQFILYYRKDILESHSEPVPRTLEELSASAARLQDPAQGLYGFIGRGQAVPLVTAVSSYVFSQGGDFITDGRASLNTPQAVKGFRTYANLLASYAPPEVLYLPWTQVMQEFAAGRAVYYTETSAIYKAILSENSFVRDKVGFALFPAGDAGAKPYNVASWALAINSGSQKKDAAWRFIQWATSKENVLEAQRSGIIGVRASAWNDPRGVENYPPQLVEVVKKTIESGSGHDVPQMIRVGEGREVVGRIVVRAVLGEDIQAAADEANQALQRLLDQEKPE